MKKIVDLSHFLATPPTETSGGIEPRLLPVVVTSSLITPKSSLPTLTTLPTPRVVEFESLRARLQRLLNDAPATMQNTVLQMGQSKQEKQQMGDHLNQQPPQAA